MWWCVSVGQESVVVDAKDPNSNQTSDKYTVTNAIPAEPTGFALRRPTPLGSATCHGFSIL